MILLTVGTASYDPLVEKMDALIGDGMIDDTVVAQIGRGHYIPHNMTWFRFLKSLGNLYHRADVIVSTGGAGTTMECVTKGYRLIVVENELLAEGHQAQLIGEMERRGHLIWCRNLNHLAESIQLAKQHSFKPYISDPPRIHKYILRLFSHTH